MCELEQQHRWGSERSGVLVEECGAAAAVGRCGVGGGVGGAVAGGGMLVTTPQGKLIRIVSVEWVPEDWPVSILEQNTHANCQK